MEMTRKQLGKILSFGKWTLEQLGPIGYMNHKVADDLKSFITEVNKNIEDNLLFVDTFTFDENDDGSLNIKGILVYDFRGHLMKNALRGIVQESDKTLVIYKNYIEDIPELEYVLQFLDGEEKHPIWFKEDNFGTNTGTSCVTFSGKYNNYLEKLEEAGLIEYISVNIIGGIINE